MAWGICNVRDLFLLSAAITDDGVLARLPFSLHLPLAEDPPSLPSG